MRWGWAVVSVILASAGCAMPDDDGEPLDRTLPPLVSSIVTTSSAPPLAATDPNLYDVVEIVDGDTLEVTAPSGSFTVRLIGVNAPERGECFFEGAADGLRFFAAGAQVRLVRDVTDVDRFGRLLRYVETADGVDVGEAVVRGGFAVSRRYPPDTARNAVYDAAQAEAQAARVGQWAPDACGLPEGPDALVTVEIEADAPGDDNDNLNAEWVRFANAGGDDLDLTGWQVADESSTHRYTFGRLTLAAGGSVTLFTGCGDDTPTERFWCNTGSAVWNNDGDTVLLRDPTGNTVLSETYRR